ncbi:hypothetical protein EIK77_000983 [Talaromyces pinophilus]|nr:hypothetical protein EIK77_000983 [Talaromyces pinophilus]
MEKQPSDNINTDGSVLESQPSDAVKNTSSRGLLARLNERIASVRFMEARGIERVPESERHSATAADYMQMGLLWFSTNITANNIAVGMLGPLDYGLSFTDSALCATFGALLGAAGAAYMGTWGPVSGNRTMVLSAVAGGNMTVVVGTIIVAIITWIVVIFGMSVFHKYERWAWVPQLIALFVLVGSAGPKFDTNIPSVGSSRDIAGNRLSFFSLCLSSSVAWAPAGADYYVYYPPTTKKWVTFTMSFFGIGLALTFANLLGVGLGSGTYSNVDWEAANEVSSGALIMQGYNGLGGFGKFLGVLIALGLIANNIPGTYSATLGFQTLGRYGIAFPRWFWTCVGVVIYTACALGGRDHLFEIFENFLALMGYWVTIFLIIVLEEHMIFRWGKIAPAFDWSNWADRGKLPLGLAAFTAFVIGWVGSIMCMYQIYYVGPIAKLVSTDGADLGIWVGCAWAMIVFPPLRWLELKKFGR